MKVLQFTLPVALDQSVISKEEIQPHFYPFLHRHSEVQLTHVIEGTGSFVIGTRLETFGPGDIFLIGANQPHLFKSAPAYFERKSVQAIRALTLFFDPAHRLKPLFALPEMKLIADFIHNRAGGFKVHAGSRDVVAAKMQAVHQSKQTDRLLLFFDLLKYLSQLDAQLASLSTATLGGLSESEGIRVGQVMHYVMQNYTRAIDLSAVAAIACMTPPAFCRYFKKQTGQTFIGFLNQVRVNEACRQLTASCGDSISAIAYRCGFNSITHFNRIFKTTVGTTPAAYQTAFRQVANS